MKKVLSIMLSLLMLTTCIFSFPIISNAENDPFSGPSDSDMNGLDIRTSQGDTNLCWRGVLTDTYMDDSVSYDLTTNTLTLNAINDSSMEIEASEMGKDFKINIVGENHIRNIIVHGGKYNGSLSIIGDGSLYVNEDRIYDESAICLDANFTESTLSVSADVELIAGVQRHSDSITVLNTTVENAISIEGYDNEIGFYTTEVEEPETVRAAEVQQNTFFKINGSDNYATYVWDQWRGDDVIYAFEIINMNIEGEDVKVASMIRDEFFNGQEVNEDDLNFGDRIIAYQIMDDNEKPVYELALSDDIFSVERFTIGEDTTEYYNIYKIIDFDGIGLVFFPYSMESTEEPTEYNEKINTYEGFTHYIYGSYPETIEDEDFYFSAFVLGSDITYGANDTIYVLPDTTTRVAFDITDNEGNGYVTGWYSNDLIENGFYVAYDPEIIDDVYYAVIGSNNMSAGDKGTLFIKGFSFIKFMDENFDFGTTEPDIEFVLNFEVISPATVSVLNDSKVYSTNETIVLKPNTTTRVTLNNIPETCLMGFNPYPMINAGFNVNIDPDIINDTPYVVINTDGMEPGTTGTLTFGINRFEDILDHNWNWEEVTPIYTYSIKFVIASDDGQAGDLDGNGEIDTNDYAILLANVQCSRALTEEQKLYCDLNHDGAIDAFDVIQLDLYLNGVCDIEGNYI